jgi:L-lactate dehydrogenase complex protein LldG
MQQVDALSTMKERAEAVQTVFSLVKDLDEALRYTVTLTKKQGGATLAAPGLEGAQRTALEALCAENGISLITENLRAHTESIHTGFTQVQWGIAETGTVVLDSTSEDTRIATMLSETHVAVVPQSRIHPNAEALQTELNQLMQSPPRYMAFISGASRTADIERVLTIGVHGPQELHILVLEENPS